MSISNIPCNGSSDHKTYVSLTNSYAEKVVMYTYEHPLITSLICGTFTFTVSVVYELTMSPSPSPGSVILFSGIVGVISAASIYTCLSGIRRLENSCCLPEVKKRAKTISQIDKIKENLIDATPEEYLQTVEQFVRVVTIHQASNGSNLPAFMPLFKEAFQGACDRGYLSCVYLLLEFLEKNPQIFDRSYRDSDFESLWGECVLNAQEKKQNGVILALKNFEAKHGFSPV